MKTILIPVDFSNASKNAVDAGINLAQKEALTLLLLHVVEVAEEGSFNVEGEADTSGSWEERLFNRMMIKKARTSLADWAEKINERGVKVMSQLRLGNVFHGITSVIDEQAVDLVIIGTGTGSNDYLGSTAEKIVRRASCPVLTVNKTIRTELKSMVLATSLSEAELVLPSVLREIIQSNNSTVHVVRINTPGLFMADYQIKDKMQDFVNQLKIKKYTLNIFNDYNEESGIIRFAESVNADLIAMATHGRTGLAHVLTGSIAEDVMNHAHRPVFTYSLKNK
jgi:nucleotide-binding universal stress UspA family protein